MESAKDAISSSWEGNHEKAFARRTNGRRLFWLWVKAWSYVKARFIQRLWFGIAGTFGGKIRRGKTWQQNDRENTHRGRIQSACWTSLHSSHWAPGRHDGILSSKETNSSLSFTRSHWQQYDGWTERAQDWSHQEFTRYGNCSREKNSPLRQSWWGERRGR